MTPEAYILTDAMAIASRAADIILEACSQAIQVRGSAFLALAGGSTPIRAYSLLSQPEYASHIDWTNLHIYWSDERLVPPEHSYSNYRSAAEALINRVPIPRQNVHRMRGELPPTESAQAYEAEMHSLLPVGRDGFPCFDMMMVGMGDDGHIASLFPGSPALLEVQRWVVASEHNQPPPPLVPRVSLTLPVINASAQVLVMVSGEKKAERVRQVLEEKPGNEPLPAQLIHPQNGRLIWLLDKGAARQLAGNSQGA